MRVVTQLNIIARYVERMLSAGQRADQQVKQATQD